MTLTALAGVTRRFRSLTGFERNGDFSTVRHRMDAVALGIRSSRWCGYVMVRVRAWLVPPLVQPRLPEFPLGVLMVTLAVPGSVMSAVVSVTCNWELLRTWVLRVVPLIMTTEDDTM